MGSAQVELMCSFTRPESFVESQSLQEHHHLLRKTLSQPESNDIAEIVGSLSDFTFTSIPVEEDAEEEQQECMAQCECCGLTEECTQGYIARTKETFCGRLVCGLCGEAVKEERLRMGPETSMDDAVCAHMKLCLKYNTFTRQDPAAHLAQAMRQILRRSVESGAPQRPRGHLWQRAGISRSKTFSSGDIRKSLP
ncbi:uncharacterized protein [Physcomitrium patens]|uniref:Uncharacterized protein n=1 Tax=Physcomitrium patens TaxID=3218 RepID=A0A2K1L6P7_PHYPA|nr:uncharacterized protein LOC112285840 [Physcomitrium patens]PNR61692.1 hypothetical protein PHYPA_000115 [Physcomitrium patens]|eukprot:XP_024382874.1 uncharacterized protein LOC112285840 [Physcomitrella patens]